MAKILDPDTLTPKRPSSNVQDYLARKYASLQVGPENGELIGWQAGFGWRPRQLPQWHPLPIAVH